MLHPASPPVPIPSHAPRRPIHSWLRRLTVAFAPAFRDPVLDQALAGMRQGFAAWGHSVQDTPVDPLDLLLTTAPFGQSLNWREALMFTARHRFKLAQAPTVVTLIHVQPAELQHLVAHFEAALAKSSPDPEDYEFPGLAPTAYRVLYEQGHRGGPMLAIQRMVQAQAKCIRVLLVVGQEQLEQIYHFDLVGAYPVSKPDGSATSLFDDVVLRLTTCLSSTDIHHHQTVGEPIPAELWASLDTPQTMCRAGYELGRRGFFTDTVFIGDLTAVPAVAGVVASQYSEGCYATWEPQLNALIATVTGSARPVDKKVITEDDLAVITGVRPDYLGALVRTVDGKRNDPPSSEAVEMFDMDRDLPRIALADGWPAPALVPVIRSKLHGHRGIRAFDPACVEYVPLDEPYLHYFVTCGTDSQARAVRAAFSRSQAMRDPADPRLVAFTILPGHGVVLAEKWVAGKAPFQVLWELMDAGRLVVDSHVPQGLFTYLPTVDGRQIVAL